MALGKYKTPSHPLQRIVEGRKASYYTIYWAAYYTTEFINATYTQRSNTTTINSQKKEHFQSLVINL